jgi:Sec-independent protein translocase protein TatA
MSRTRSVVRMRPETIRVPGSLKPWISTTDPHRETAALRRRIAAFALPHYDEAMSFSETIFLFFLALIIFGPKKLPEIARQAGRLLAELRRASNEFKSQIETEIAHLEVEKTQTILPPSPPPLGTVASMNPTPVANDPVAHQPELPPAPATAGEASANSSLSASTSTTPPVEAVAEHAPAAGQESHV